MPDTEKEYEVQTSMAYAANDPLDAARQFIGNVRVTPDWQCQVRDTVTGETFIVDTAEGTVEAQPQSVIPQGGRRTVAVLLELDVAPGATVDRNELATYLGMALNSGEPRKPNELFTVADLSVYQDSQSLVLDVQEGFIAENPV